MEKLRSREIMTKEKNYEALACLIPKAYTKIFKPNYFMKCFQNTKTAIKRRSGRSRKIWGRQRYSKLNTSGESCAVLRLRLMPKLALCHMHFMSLIYISSS